MQNENLELESIAGYGKITGYHISVKRWEGVHF